jgi:hypothetical protein
MPDLPFLDSFDHYLSTDGSQKWTTGGPTIGIGTGRRGTNGALVAGGGLAKTFNNEYSTLYAGAAFKNSGDSPFRFLNAINRINISLPNVGDGRLMLNGSDPTIGNFSPQLWSGVTPPLLNDRWYYIEMMVSITPTTASAIVRINEEIVITESVAFAGTISSHCGFATINISGRAQGLYTDVDDVYVDSDGFYGDVNIDVIRPDGPDTTTWIPSPNVANYLNVKDITPDGDATVVSSATVNDLDLYTMEDIPSNAIVKAIQGIASVKKDTAGLAALKVQYGATGGSPLFSDEFYPSEISYIMLRDGRKDILTPAAINALVFGVLRTK